VFNDASVDPAGRVWVGEQHMGYSESICNLYRLDPGGVLTAVLTGVTVSNGTAWSPDGSRMYYTDSMTRRVDVFDYDPATGEATQRRLFTDLSGVDGFPDGLTVDADGYVWMALGSALYRFTPAGAHDAVIPLPVSKPLSLALGGPDLSELYVTTSSFRFVNPLDVVHPLDGRLLRLSPGAVGLPATTTPA
jgi:sugar lactone lactonase YvrE